MRPARRRSAGSAQARRSQQHAGTARARGVGPRHRHKQQHARRLPSGRAPLSAASISRRHTRRASPRREAISEHHRPIWSTTPDGAKWGQRSASRVRRAGPTRTDAEQGGPASCPALRSALDDAHAAGCWASASRCIGPSSPAAITGAWMLRPRHKLRQARHMTAAAVACRRRSLQLRAGREYGILALQQQASGGCGTCIGSGIAAESDGRGGVEVPSCSCLRSARLMPPRSLPRVLLSRRARA